MIPVISTPPPSFFLHDNCRVEHVLEDNRFRRSLQTEIVPILTASRINFSLIKSLVESLIIELQTKKQVSDKIKFFTSI